MGDSFRLYEDSFVPGSWVLSVGGIRQSHVDPSDPGRLFFEYTRRIGHVIDLIADPGAPIRVLHLGGGGLTMARYVALTRPDSHQVVVDIDREQTEFVLDRLPLPSGADVAFVYADALRSLGELAASDEIAFDVAIVDIYEALESPEYVGVQGFFASLVPLVALGGAIAVNVADGPSRIQAHAQRHELARVVEATLAVAPARVMAGEEAGNIVLVGGDGELVSRLAPELERRGPHPVTVEVD